MINHFFLIGLGGAIGSAMRYLCQRWLGQLLPQPFPIGTLAVNVIGCFLIGIFWGYYAKPLTTDSEWKLFLMTGWCGGFTTFSAFTLDGVHLLKEQRLGLFFLYVGASLVIGLAATYLGIRLMKQ
ncbi:MAG: camphor resistance protein CrcB [Bacteroidota bacterium]|jgi:CrcB protein